MGGVEHSGLRRGPGRLEKLPVAPRAHLRFSAIASRADCARDCARPEATRRDSARAKLLINSGTTGPRSPGTAPRMDYKSDALPTELRQHIVLSCELRGTHHHSPS